MSEHKALLEGALDMIVATSWPLAKRQARFMTRHLTRPEQS